MGSAALYHIVVVLIICNLHVINSAGGRVYTTVSNREYYINPAQNYTWFDALSECSKMKMSLVSIETDIKSQEINKLVKDTFNKSVILWVGGVMTHYPDSRNYIWINTGQQFSFTFWKRNNPDFSLNNEYCIQIGCDSNMEWNDNVCETKYGFMCEYPQQLGEHSVEDPTKQLRMEKRLQECQQSVKTQQQHNEILAMLSKERENLLQELQKQKELTQELQTQLQQIQVTREQDQRLMTDKHKLQQALQRQQLELVQQLQKGSQNLQLALGKQQDGQHFMEEKKELEKKTTKYSDLSFQFNQNTYFLPNAQLTLNGNH